MFTIAILGRPNVGKSTLFNKLVGKSMALVSSAPGMTRDRKEAIGYLGSLEFKVIDTAGWYADPQEEALEQRMVEQTEKALKEANLCIFMVDGQTGVLPIDELLARRIRKFNVDTILVVNKCENGRKNYGFDAEYYLLGFGEPVGISAEHRDGFNFLYDAIEPYYDAYEAKYGFFSSQEEDYGKMKKPHGKEATTDEEKTGLKNAEEPLRLALVGKPNSGKSTLMNRLLGEDRVIVGAEAGITRDSITIDWEYENKKIKLIDTAGIRKKRNINDDLEQFSVEESLRVIRYAQVVIMLVDSQMAFAEQDMALASLLIREGRGVVFALNKWDLVRKNGDQILKEAKTVLDSNAPELRGCPLVPISALDGTHVDRLMEAVFRVFRAWNSYVNTSKLNQWLRSLEIRNPPPLFRGQMTKLKYLTQIKRRPPTFALFTNSPARLEKTSYDRFIVNSLRNDFGLNETVVRLLLRKSANPYDSKRKK